MKSKSIFSRLAEELREYTNFLSVEHPAEELLDKRVYAIISHLDHAPGEDPLSMLLGEALDALDRDGRTTTAEVLRRMHTATRTAWDALKADPTMKMREAFAMAARNEAKYISGKASSRICDENGRKKPGRKNGVTADQADDNRLKNKFIEELRRRAISKYDGCGEVSLRDAFKEIEEEVSRGIPTWKKALSLASEKTYIDRGKHNKRYTITTRA